MIGKLINPVLGIHLIKKQIKKQLNKDIEDFQIIYYAETDKLIFVIDKLNYEFDSDIIKSVLKMQTKNVLQKSDKLTAVILDINKDEKIKAKIYLIQNGKKLIINHNMN